MSVPVLGISSPEIKLAKDLSSGKKVDDDSLFICEGLWASKKLVQKEIEVPLFMYCPNYIKTDEDRINTEILLKHSLSSYEISEKACRKISDRDGADGFFMICRLPSYSLYDMDLVDEMIIMILDGQEQPGNIGAIIRSMDAAGGDFAVITNRRVKSTHCRLIRSSLGAAFMKPLIYSDMDTLTKWLRDNKFKIVLTDLTATQAYFDVDYSGRVAIVAGNEYTGISHKWRNVKGVIPVIIPMLGSVESLNVGFASTLVAYEARKFKTFN